jgi:hypothetical protein
LNDFDDKEEPLFPIDSTADLLKKMPDLFGHNLAALCDSWDAFSKGASPTTHAIREARMADIAEMVRDASA